MILYHYAPTNEHGEILGDDWHHASSEAEAKEMLGGFQFGGVIRRTTIVQEYSCGKDWHDMPEDAADDFPTAN